MPKPETIEKFIAQVETNEHDKAIELFYHENASMQENNSKPRVGRDFLVNNEREVLAKTKSVASKCIKPVFINGDNVVIRWQFTFNWLNGTTTNIEEIAYQRWEGEKIMEEKFFYDPAQMTPK
jgi:hypothetical protein